MNNALVAVGSTLWNMYWTESQNRQMLWGSGGCCRPHCFWPSYLVSLGFLSSRFGHIWKRAIKKVAMAMNQKLQSRCGLLTSWPLLMMIRAQQSLPAIVSGGKLDQADATVSQNWEFHPEIVWDGENQLFLSFFKIKLKYLHINRSLNSQNIC